MTVDEYVIKIYHDINIQNMIFNGLLEGYRNISKAKYHYKPFKWLIKSPKISLLFVSINYAD